MISARLKNKCVVCELQKETLEHFLIECNFYSCIKEKYNDQLLKLDRLSGESNKVLTGLILGNEHPCLSQDLRKELTIKMIEMVSEMLKFRAVFTRKEMQEFLA